MDLFKRMRRQQLPPLFTTGELEFSQAINFDQVLEYLVGLSDQEYAQVCDVAQIYRRADQEASTALGNKSEPTTFINPPVAPETRDETLDFMDFLTDDPKPKVQKKVSIV